MFAEENNLIRRNNHEELLDDVWMNKVMEDWGNLPPLATGLKKLYLSWASLSKGISNSVAAATFLHESQKKEINALGGK